jgi:hypothetical protein
MWGQKYDTIAKVSTHLLKKIFQAQQGFQRFQLSFQIYDCHASVIDSSNPCHFLVRKESNFMKIPAHPAYSLFHRNENASCRMIFDFKPVIRSVSNYPDDLFIAFQYPYFFLFMDGHFLLN